MALPRLSPRSGPLMDHHGQDRVRAGLAQQRAPDRHRPAAAQGVVHQQHRTREGDARQQPQRLLPPERLGPTPRRRADGAGPVTSSASRSGSRPTSATCAASPRTSRGRLRDGIGTTDSGRSHHCRAIGSARPRSRRAATAGAHRRAPSRRAPRRARTRPGSPANATARPASTCSAAGMRPRPRSMPGAHILRGSTTVSMPRR